MAGEYFFSVGTVGRSTVNGRKPSTLIGAARHNRRTIQVENDVRGNIHRERSHLNEVLFGPATPDEVARLANGLMAQAGINPQSLRRDCAQAIEFVFSLPVNSGIDDGLYFRDCLAWTQRTLPEQPVLSADIHRDEAAPHCHVLILPLVDGKMKGSELVARKRTAQLTESFFNGVAVGYGLQRKKAMSAIARTAAATAVIEALKSSGDAILKSALWQPCRLAIQNDPGPFAAALGIALPERLPVKRRSFTQIMTSKGKGPQRERNESPIPIGFGRRLVSESHGNSIPIGFDDGGNMQSLSCVGIASTNSGCEEFGDDFQPPENTGRRQGGFAAFMASRVANL